MEWRLCRVEGVLRLVRTVKGKGYNRTMMYTCFSRMYASVCAFVCVELSIAVTGEQAHAFNRLHHDDTDDKFLGRRRIFSFSFLLYYSTADSRLLRYYRHILLSSSRRVDRLYTIICAVQHGTCKYINICTPYMLSNVAKKKYDFTASAIPLDLYSATGEE